MVKSGEVYYVDVLPDGDYMQGDDRPRNIMIGSSSKHGASTYMQSIMHPTLRRNVPGYIQGYTKDQLHDKLSELVPHASSISMDGSAFESTQHASLMRIVDDRVYRMFHKLLTKHLPENSFFQRHL